MTHGRDSYARPDLLVETDWLAQHLNDPGVRIIDCDPYDSYRRAHIPGAVGIQVHHYIKDASNSVYVMPPDQFAQLMGQLGVGPETLVVTYDGFGSLYAARMWWVLSYYGHTRVKVLNGGWDKWLKEGRSITRQVPRVARAAFTPQVDPNLICTLDYARSCVGKKDAIFLDVRSDGEWTGENRRSNKRGGHVPGAVHLEWLNFVTDDDVRVFKPASALRAMLEGAGASPEREVITY